MERQAIGVLTELRAKYANGEHSWGVDGETGKIVDMKSYGLYESASVKIQIVKTAVEAARMPLRVGNVVQATRKERNSKALYPKRWLNEKHSRQVLYLVDDESVTITIQ
ncbi:hypothetical protein EV363DRAFT_1285603 [Boletus edulis]|nr:hypothetical protein EV363DRAFT_1285603 [Boletus edulis]